MALILVTGGAGFIGSHLVDALIARGERVRVLDDLSTGSKENLAGALRTGRCDLVAGKVEDPATIASAIEGCRRVYHLAATVGVRRVLEDPATALRNNILGTDSVLRAARSLELESIVIFSSSEVYGRSSRGPLSEEEASVIGPTAVARWSYAAGKAVGEFLALGEHHRSGLPVTIVRCFNTCGPRQVDTYGMVLPAFLKQALLGRPIQVYGDGSQTRCFSFVGDVVRGVIDLSREPAARGGVFNIGSDEEVAIRELAVRVSRLCGRPPSIQPIPYEEAYGPGFEDVPRRVPDLSRIRRLVQYRPLVDLDELIARTRDWIRSELPDRVPAR